MARKISEIAREIEAAWSATKNGVHYTAKPYLDAMFFLDDARSVYFQDDAKGIVIRFLGNARSYTGPIAKAHKAELKQIVGIK